ncbi:SPFH domain-containing protein [Olleya sp. R77988]|uniref:SPFH domain-containing protein n=1 Tax=Olleya sp. R77988 TaxID=3093875 RepID=UPI0037CB947D
MKIKKVFLSSIFLLILFGCIQKNNQSRQFSKLMKIQALSTDGKEITLSIQNYYLFISEQSKPFDQKGYFRDEKENGDYIMEPILRMAVRSVIGRYNPTELSIKTNAELENQIIDSANSLTIESEKKDKLKVQINAIILKEIIYSESAKESIVDNE